MPIYTCTTCGKGFDQIGHYNIHKSRKRPCKKGPTLEEIVEKKVAAALIASGITPEKPVENTIINQTIKPLIKYVGGKTQILPHVMAQFPKNLTGNYYEPFVGGGSVLFTFLENNPDFKGDIVAADLNPRLISFYRNIRDNVGEVLVHIKKIVDAYNAIKEVNGSKKPMIESDSLASQEAYYYWMRIRYNTLCEKDASGPLGAALFLFLNKTCFRGLHRCGPHGFNVPFGNYKNPAIYDIEHINIVSELLERVQLRCTDFEEIMGEAGAGDFVYMDPPYVPLPADEEGDNKKSFVGYNADGFAPSDHERFFVACEKLTAKKVDWLMSNSDVPDVRNRFPEGSYNTSIVVCRRSINAKEPGSRVNEVLIRSSGPAVAVDVDVDVDVAVAVAAAPAVAVAVKV